MANPLLTFMQGGGDANNAVRLAALRQQQLREDQGRVDTRQLQSDIATDPFTGDAAQADQAKHDAFDEMLGNYSRPDVAAMRNEEFGNKLKLATAPAETAGRYQVQAAQAAGAERAKLAEQNQAEQNARSAQTQQNIGQRQAATQQNINDRQRVTGLQKGTISAMTPAPSGGLEQLQNFFGLGKFDQGGANQAEIAHLQGGASGAQSRADFSNPQIGDTGIDAQGRKLQFDGHGWAIVE